MAILNDDPVIKSATMTKQELKRIVILASGNGSNAQAIIDACKLGKINAKVELVISNIPNAFVLERAQEMGVDSLCVNHKSFESRTEFDTALAAEIDKADPDIIVLAGFMRILSDDFVNKYLGKLLNIHPSLLPKYPGLNTHQRALQAKDKEHGTSVHFVTPELDGGPVILQARVPVFDGDEISELAERVQSQEYEIYPLVVNWLASNRIVLKEGKAFLDGNLLAESGYANE